MVTIEYIYFIVTIKVFKKNYKVRTLTMMSEKIKLIMVKRKINSSELANVLECTPQNVSRLFKKDNWTEEQLRKIADRLNCELEINFRLKDTNERF